MDVLTWLLAIAVLIGILWGVRKGFVDAVNGKIPPPPRTIATVTSRRPTMTRTGAGLLLGGLPGALVGFAWRKKTREKIEVIDDRYENVRRPW